MFLLNLLAEEAEKPTGCTTQQYIIYGVLLVILVAFFVWSTMSSKKKQKKEQEKIAAVKVGDKVKTIGGVCGYIVEMNEEENTFVVETGLDANKSYIKFDKAAIYQTAAELTEPPVEEAKAEVKEETVEEKTESTVDGKKID